jgi:hypothetical protein
VIDVEGTYVMDIPGAASGVSLGARILVDDENGLEEVAIDLRYDDGDGDGDFGVIVDIPRWVFNFDGTYVRTALTTVEDDDAVGSLLMTWMAGRNDMVR